MILSSPYAASGVLYDLHRKAFDVDDAETLVWQATAPEMNPTLPADYLRAMQETDPEGYAAEVGGEFRAGLSLLLDPRVIDAAVDEGVILRPYESGAHYVAHYDASRGKSDAASLSIGDRLPDNTVVLDSLRVWPAPPRRREQSVETGRLVKWVNGRGYGFISPQVGGGDGADLFVHVSALLFDGDSVTPGMRVNFRTNSRSTGPGMRPARRGNVKDGRRRCRT